MTSPNPKPNEHIETCLNEYCNNNRSAGNNYALLINGKWGIGKTYLIQEYKKNRKNTEENKGKSYIAYTSVNGISKTSDLSRAMLNDLLDSDVKSSFCIIRKVKFLFSLVIAALLLSPLQWYIEKPLNYDFGFVLIRSFALSKKYVNLARKSFS